jgi:uncharacterized coiled-coil protein SlyX
VVTSEGRLAYLEGRIVEQGQMFSLIDSRLAGMDQRLAGMDQKLAGMDPKLAAMEQRLEHAIKDAVESLTRQIRACDEKYAVEVSALRRDMASQFRWTTGMFLTGFVAILAAIVTR